MREHKCVLANMVCPRNNDPMVGKYCPKWLEYTETNAVTGEERITKECSELAIPRFFVETIKASNRPAAAVESYRNEMAKGFQEVARRLERIPALLLENHDDS